MKNEIISYLSKYVSLTDELKNIIVESALIKKFSKGTILLQEGDEANDCFFVLKGCIRCYYLKDGDEKTTEFYTEGHVVNPLNYGKDVPSSNYLQCTEDTIAAVGNPAYENEMYRKYPQLESLNRVISEAIMTEYKETHYEYKMASPEERYLQLLEKRPGLLQRVPHYQIASYLGIAPESLSRIRKRIKIETE